eukprot:scaffold12014_cov45-Attheya_sp.AAC.1
MFQHTGSFANVQSSIAKGNKRRALGEPFGKKSAPIPIVRNSKNVSKLQAPQSRKQLLLEQSKDARRRKTSQGATKQSNSNSIEARARSEKSTANNSKTAYQYSNQADNIDKRDLDDPLSAADYAAEIFSHFRENEKTTSVGPNYMEHQGEINTRMRAILVDWLVQVHHKFKMVPETLYLTVNLIDRYLEKRYVSRQELQLVGVASLLIASKYEEIYIPEMSDFVYICDNAYTKDEILQMETIVLTELNYKVTIASSHAFLVRYLKAAHADKRMVQFACYILDGTLQNYHLLEYLPSQLAAASVLIARRCIGRHSWSPTLLKYAEYSEEDVTPVARSILTMRASSAGASELHAVNRKYSSNAYGAVAHEMFDFDLSNELEN